MSAYLDVFTESALVASIIPFTHDPSFLAMLSFGGYNMPLATALAILGAATGAVFNFTLGRLLLYFYQKKNWLSFLSIETYNKSSGIFLRYFFVLLPFSWLSTLNFFVFLAGFLGTRAKLALSLVMAGQIAHYGWYLFAS